MGIVKLKPAFKDYLWGGTKLKEHYGKTSDYDIVAESWEVSSHPDGLSTIDSGDHKGLSLVDYIETQGRHILGSNGQRFDFFPVLIKFIDAQQDLSIQVHPNDTYALKNENQYGKTEMWYILEADEGAVIYYGTKSNISKDEYASAIESNTILDVLNKVPVKKGDVIFVEAGTIHAIGAGIVICEIQQNSNVTYRVYDFDRVDAQGNKRDLHINQAVDVSTLEPLDSSFKPQGELINLLGRDETDLVIHDLFKTKLIEVYGEFSYSTDSTSFAALVCIEGNIKFKLNNEVIELSKGESVFVDADTRNILISGNGSLIHVIV